VAEINLRETIERARTAQGAQLENLLYHRSGEVLDALLGNPALREQHLLLLLSRKDLSREMLTAIAQKKQWMRSYSLKTAVLKHPKTPRHVALPLLRFIYLFDLVEIASAVGVAPDLKRLVEDTILAQREGLATGQRLALARRGTHRVAGGLLNDPDPRVIQAALQNPALTEQAVAAALQVEKGAAELTAAVAENARWKTRRGIKLALVRSRHLSLARFAAILPDLTLPDLDDLVDDPRVAPNIRSYVAKLAGTRKVRMKKKKV